MQSSSYLQEPTKNEHPYEQVDATKNWWEILGKNASFKIKHLNRWDKVKTEISERENWKIVLGNSHQKQHKEIKTMEEKLSHE